MDSSRCDVWTRRRLGGAGGGLAVILFGLALPSGTAGKSARKRCQKVTQRCQKGNKKKRCCRGLLCREVAFQSGLHCCRGLREACNAKEQCCGELLCDEIDTLEGTRCCGDLGAPCQIDGDCCGNIFAFCNTLKQCDMV